MQKKLSVLFLLIGLLAMGIAAYFNGWLLPTAIESKGDNDTVVAVIALCTSVVSLLTGIIGLVKAAVDLKKLRSEK